jgi:hypothetical protein
LYQGTASAVPREAPKTGIGPSGPGKEQRSNAVQFQIKGQDFFLAFVEQEKRWYVFSPTAQGINRIPVYVDAVQYERAGILDINTSLSS